VGIKDTLRNVRETGEFVLNLATEAFAEAMDATSADLESGESEFEFAGLESAPSTTVTPPRVAGVAAAMECTMYDTMPVYDNVLVFGEVERFHVDESLLTGGRIDARKVDAIGRLGGPYYTSIDRSEMERNFE